MIAFLALDKISGLTKIHVLTHRDATDKYMGAAVGTMNHEPDHVSYKPLLTRVSTAC